MKDKKIGFTGALSTGVGMMIATSCFISLAGGTSKIGITFIISIIIACLVNLAAASSISELNALMPYLTGGIGQYTMAALGPFMAVIVVAGGYLIANVFAAPAEGAMFANVCTSFFGEKLPVQFYSVVLTVILIVINIRGVNFSAMVQTAVAVILMISLILMGLIGAAGLGRGPRISQPLVLSYDPADILSDSAAAFWFFIGFEFIVPLGKDMKDPKKNISRAMFTGMLVMCLIQCLMAVGFAKYVPWKTLAVSSSPHLLLAESLLGKTGRNWMIVVGLLAAVSTQNSIICSVSEICCGMAKSGLFPAFMQKKNKYGSPYVMILLLGGVTLLIEAFGMSNGIMVQFLILTSSLFIMLAYMVSDINVIVLRHRMNKTPRTYRSRLYPVTQIFGIAGTLYMMTRISDDPSERTRIYEVFSILLAAIIIYAFIWIRLKKKQPLFRYIPSEKVMAMENTMYYIVRRNRALERKKSTADRNV